MFLPKSILRFFSQIHVTVYHRSRGQRRNRMNGLPVLLITTTGRRTSKPHTVPVVYLADHDGYLVAPGIVPRPDWYLNLKHDSRANIQVGWRVVPVMAEELTGPERSRLWASVPAYWQDYERRAGITLPLIRLRVSE